MDDTHFFDIPIDARNEYLGKLGGCGNCRYMFDRCRLPDARRIVWKQIYDNGCGALQTSMITVKIFKNTKKSRA